MSLSLSAVNLSESAQGKMAPVQLAEIYVTAATALRSVLGHHLSFLAVRPLLINQQFHHHRNRERKTESVLVSSCRVTC